ncbi:hypothetical protein B0H10DRAFT_2022977 [Mycena sp. CBHHK59/15]|nr:hypothetical protein B0H10DRAFT_2022977 [Mycena sp. CBHHK59/15]
MVVASPGSFLLDGQFTCERLTTLARLNDFSHPFPGVTSSPPLASLDASSSTTRDWALDSPLSDLTELPSEDETLMDFSSSLPSRIISAAQSSPSPALKRKRFKFDHVLLPTLLSLQTPKISTNLEPEDSPPVKKIRRSQSASPVPSSPRHTISHLRDQTASGDLDEEHTFSPPDPLSTRDTFVTDIESCLDSILNQLAEEIQRREALHQVYASVSYNTVDDAASNTDFSIATDFEEEPFISPHADASDDELSMNLFENAFVALNITDFEPELKSSSSGPELPSVEDFRLFQGSFLDEIPEDRQRVTNSSVLGKVPPVSTAPVLLEVGVSLSLLDRRHSSSSLSLVEDEPSTPLAVDLESESSESRGPDKESEIHFGVSPSLLYRSDSSLSLSPELSTPMAVDLESESSESRGPDKESEIHEQPFLTHALDPEKIWWGSTDIGENDGHASDVTSDSDELGPDLTCGIPNSSLKFSLRLPTDYELSVDAPRSRCPCNQCSPNAPLYPDYHPSRHTQQDIHKLFLLSPFSHD